MSHPWHLYHADTRSASSLPSNMPLSTFPNPQTGLSGSAMGYLLHRKNAEQWGHVIWNLCIHLCIANRPSQHYNQIRSEHYESQKDNQTGINYGTTLIHPTTNHLEQKPATTVFPQIEYLASEQSDLAHKNLSTSLKQTQGQPAFLSVGLFSFFFQNNEAPGLEHFEALINFITSFVIIFSCYDSITTMTDCMKLSMQKKCAQIKSLVVHQLGLVLFPQ